MKKQESLHQKEKIRIIIIGAGNRGMAYASHFKEHLETAQIVGVAEPKEYSRTQLAKVHRIPKKYCFSDWREVAQCDKFADAVVIATQDSMHLGPALAFANLGYHILLEKPMAPNKEDCEKIVLACKKNEVLLAVCHVLRYTRYTQKLKMLLDSGTIGEIVNLQHLEPVGYWHQAHSFVRGNWRNEEESSFMLLSKACHDLDWIRYIIGASCQSVSSFGSLQHFKKENQPTNAASRCLDCDYEPQCPYSAKKIYLRNFLEKGCTTGWPLDVLTNEITEEAVLKALKNGPYGRCVYDCDNDVVDHQVVNLLFEGGKTATFTMTAFTQAAARKTRIFGTRGEIEGDGSIIRVFDFLTDQTQTIDLLSSDSSLIGGHGGGDSRLVEAFLKAVANQNSDFILSGPDESLETHKIVFASEKARKEKRVLSI